MWSRKFLAYARMRGYADVVLGSVQVAKISVDLSDTANPAVVNQLNVRTRNAEAYNAMVMAIEETDAFYCVEDACTDEYPFGLASLAWTNLKNRYEPTTITTGVELTSLWYKMTLVDLNKTPDSYFTELQHIRSRLRGLAKPVVLSDQDFMIKVLGSLPQEYATIVTLMEAKLNDDSLTVDILKNNLRHAYKKLIMARGTNNLSDNFGLAATEYPEADYSEQDYAFAAFKGLCRNCGQRGHTGNKCPLRSGPYGRGGRAPTTRGIQYARAPRSMHLPSPYATYQGGEGYYRPTGYRNQQYSPAQALQPASNFAPARMGPTRPPMQMGRGRTHRGRALTMGRQIVPRAGQYQGYGGVASQAYPPRPAARRPVPMAYFDGQCHKCGTFGHKISQCPQWTQGYAHYASPIQDYAHFASPTQGYAQQASPVPHTQYAPEYSEPTYEEQHAFEMGNLNAELEQVEYSEGDYSDQQYGFEEEPTEHYI